MECVDFVCAWLPGETDAATSACSDATVDGGRALIGHPENLLGKDGLRGGVEM
jgi:hypothetical protein